MGALNRLNIQSDPAAGALFQTNLPALKGIQNDRQTFIKPALLSPNVLSESFELQRNVAAAHAKVQSTRTKSIKQRILLGHREGTVQGEDTD
jgi:hypothetical protein